MKTVLMLLFAGAVLIAADNKIAGGPYVVNVTPRSATVVWIVRSEDTTYKPAGGATHSAPALRVEKTMLSGLQANTAYEYDIPGAGKGSFRTAPVKSGAFTFAAYGDNRTRNDIHRRIVETLVSKGIPDFILQTGDMVADGYDGSLWPVFFDIEKDLLRKTAFFPSLGNHERNTPMFYELFQRSLGYYSFDWGNAHFTVLNSDIANVSPIESERAAYWAEETRWLEEDLKCHQDADFRFISGHHPPFTAVERRQGDNPHMTDLTPMFEKYRVTAAFFGHDHNYQHYLKNGIHYVISGGGGAPLYDVDRPPLGITQKVQSIENFLSVRVDGKTAHVQAISMDGKVLDEIDLH